MMHLNSLYFFTFVTIIANGKKLKFYSNFIFENLVYGPEDVVVDYSILADDPIGNLPESYTVCSSVFIKFATTDILLIQMLKQDDTPWYRLAVSASREYDTMSEILILRSEDPTTGKFQEEYFSTHIPIVPRSWYHVCMGLDTVSGMLRIVVNGVVMVNEKKDYFSNTIVWKPKSLEGKLLLFKSYLSVWYQNRGVISNLNIFKDLMSVDRMVRRTTWGEDCSSPGDYLRQ